MGTRNIINTIEKHSQKKLGFLFFIFLFVTNFFNIKFVSGSMQHMLLLPIVAGIYFYVLMKRRTYEKMNFSMLWSCFALTTFISVIPCFIYHDQSIFSSLKATSVLGGMFIFYFYLHKIHPSEKTIIKFYYVVSIVIFIIQIFQQYYPAYAIFGVRESEFALESYVVEQRNGLYRFRIFNAEYTFPIFFLFCSLLLRRFSLRIFIPTILIVISIYLLLTRQIMLAVPIGVVYGCLFCNIKINKKVIVVFSIIIFGFLSLYFDTLFSALFEQSQEQIDDESYVRFLSGEFFLKKSLENPLIFLFGNGMPSQGSSYGIFMQNLEDNYHFFSCDVGFIGAGYRFGYVHVLIFFIIVYLILWKYRQQIPAYLKMTIFAEISISIMIFPIWFIRSWFSWCIMLYLCDLHINKSQLCCIEC